MSSYCIWRFTNHHFGKVSETSWFIETVSNWKFQFVKSSNSCQKFQFSHLKPEREKVDKLLENWLKNTELNMELVEKQFEKKTFIETSTGNRGIFLNAERLFKGNPDLPFVTHELSVNFQQFLEKNHSKQKSWAVRLAEHCSQWESVCWAGVYHQRRLGACPSRSFFSGQAGHSSEVSYSIEYIRTTMWG